MYSHFEYFTKVNKLIQNAKQDFCVIRANAYIFIKKTTNKTDLQLFK